MSVQRGKENILKKIRQALESPVPLPYPDIAQSGFFPAPSDDLSVLFAEEFTRIAGKFSFCTGLPDLERQLSDLFATRNWNRIYYANNLVSSSSTLPSHFNDLADCDASVTGCEWLVARTGSIILSSANEGGRTASVYAPVHICIAFTNQVVFDIADALAKIKTEKLPSFFTVASGPSRTADIEKTLVTGVHGPKEVFCFLVDNQK